MRKAGKVQEASSEPPFYPIRPAGGQFGCSPRQTLAAVSGLAETVQEIAFGGAQASDAAGADFVENPVKFLAVDFVEVVPGNAPPLLEIRRRCLGDNCLLLKLGAPRPPFREFQIEVTAQKSPQVREMRHAVPP